MASALRTGIILTAIGLVIFIVSEFIPQLIAKQICESDTKLNQSNTLQGCAEAIQLALRVFWSPCMVLILVGLIIVIMAAINRLDNKRLGLPIEDDWGTRPIRRF